MIRFNPNNPFNPYGHLLARNKGPAGPAPIPYKEKIDFPTMVQNAQSYLMRVAELKRGEKVFVTYDYDEVGKTMAEAFIEAAKRLGNPVETYSFNPLFFSEELVRAVIANGPCVFINTLRVTQDVAEAQLGLSTGAEVNRHSRIIHMSKASAPMLLQDIDYGLIQARAAKISDILRNTSRIRITTDLGTNLYLDVTGRAVRNDTKAIQTEQNHNFPPGEVFIAPIESKTQGTLVVDATVAMFGLPPAPMAMEIRNGKIQLDSIRFLSAVEDDSLIADFKEFLAENPGAEIICEFAIGVAPYSLVGNVSIDEKVYTTAHIGFGYNLNMGGKIDAPLHGDLVFQAPTIRVLKIDGSELVLLEKGELVI